MTREEAVKWLKDYLKNTDLSMPQYEEALCMAIKALEQEPKTGHWVRHTKIENVYDIKGVKTWGIKCQCDKCDFTTIVIEDFGYYNYCPNCGARMESEDKE